MNGRYSVTGVLTAIAAVLVLLCLAPGCSTTAPTQTNVITGERTAPPESGFLGDYSQLKPGGKDRAALVFINPGVAWSKYTKIIVEPVQFWDSMDSTVPVSDQQMLASYFYNALRDNLQNFFILVDRPGPEVLKLETAITNVTAATPVLRSVSVIVPQARVLNTAQSLATGSYAFAGSAQAEGQIVDSMTGTRLAAAVDQRQGGMSLKAANQWKWGDAQNVFDYWAQRISQRLADLKTLGRTND